MSHITETWARTNMFLQMLSISRFSADFMSIGPYWLYVMGHRWSLLHIGCHSFVMSMPQILRFMSKIYLLGRTAGFIIVHILALQHHCYARTTRNVIVSVKKQSEKSLVTNETHQNNGHKRKNLWQCHLDSTIIDDVLWNNEHNQHTHQKQTENYKEVQSPSVTELGLFLVLKPVISTVPHITLFPTKQAKPCHLNA